VIICQKCLKSPLPYENGEKKKLKEGDLGPAEKRKKVKKNLIFFYQVVIN
jgi:hypothetical protein